MSTSLHVLINAVEQRSPAVVKTGGRRAADYLQVCFLADGRPAGEDGIWAELAQGDIGFIDRLIAGKIPVECSFVSGATQVSFETTIVTRRRPFLRGERLLLTWPQQLRVHERRRGERELVPEEVEISAKLKLPPDGRIEMPLYVWDLSASGAAFLCPPGKRPPKFEPGQKLEVYLSFGGREHAFAVFHRNSQTLSGGRVRLGVEFADGGALPETLEKLHELLDDLKTRRIRNTLGSALGKKNVA